MNKKNSSRLNLIVFVLVIVVNYLTATGMISGIAPQKEVSGLNERTEIFCIVLPLKKGPRFVTGGPFYNISDIKRL